MLIHASHIYVPIQEGCHFTYTDTPQLPHLPFPGS